MKRFLVVLTGTLAVPCALAADAAPGLTQEAMRQAAESFYSVELDASRSYTISRAQLRRDRLQIELEGGTLTFAQPILGRVTGACYSGTARLSLTPPGPREKASLRANINSDTFEAQVESLYLRFNDSTVADLTATLEPAPSPRNAERCSKLFERRNRIVRKYESGTIGTVINLELDFLESLLSPELSRDFFLLEADVPGRDWVTYLQRPGRQPSAALMRLKPMGSLFEPQLWSAYDLGGPAASAPGAGKSLDIVHNQMEIVIPNITSLTIDAWIDWKGPVDLNSLRFEMINSYGGSTWDDPGAKPVTIELITTEDGTPLPFVHRRHEVLARMPQSVPAGQTARVRVRATESTIIQLTPESFSLLNTYPWFPQEPDYSGGDYTFDWTVKVKRPMIAAGSGTTVREWTDKKAKLNCAQWKSDIPMPFPSLIFGKFRKIEGEYERREDGKPVTIRVFWTPSTTFTYRDDDGNLKTDLVTVPGGKPKQLVKEIGIILDFYEQVLGPYPHDEIDLAQMAPGMWFGQAPPGLVQITGEYFFSQALISSAFQHPGVMDFLRTLLAHEIAHHWWGDVVRWAGDEEQWLSESLAEYSAGLYLEASDGEKAFRQKMNSWRKMCVRWEGDLPIIHAHRASGDNAFRIRQALLYNKGPLIVHMLRSQVGNEKFKAILKKLLTDQRGKWIDTEDFRETVESVVGYRMGWFFDQWVRETGIPELHFSYTVAPHEGKYLFTARLRQSNAKNPKALFVPLVFHFSGERHGRKEWRVKKADETLRVVLPEKPEKVTIDEAGDLLAKIVYD
ncbi:MAG: M1 family aminopeptidase [Acidobacteriota bacterium]